MLNVLKWFMYSVFSPQKKMYDAMLGLEISAKCGKNTFMKKIVFESFIIK